VLDNHLPDRRTGPSHHIDHARRNTHFLRDVRQRQCGKRRLTRGLDDDRVATRQRRSNLPGRQEQRKIPRHNRGHHADRFAKRVGEEVALYRDGLAVNLVGPACVVLKALGSSRDLDLAGLENGFAVMQRLESRELVGAGHQVLAEFPKQPSALARRQLPPRTVEGRASRPDGIIDVFPVRHSNSGDDFFSGRIDDFKRLAGCGASPLPVDEHLRAHGP
jgi:hypothetical protein